MADDKDKGAGKDGVKKEDAAPIYRLGLGSRQHFQKFLTGTALPDPGGAVQDPAFEPEDEYQNYYVGRTEAKSVLEPPYNQRHLDRLSQENNALSPCIEAMVTNVDGTGYDFTSYDEEADDDKDDKQVDALRQFFSQPWPGESFKSMRKKLRRDIKRIGNGYLEVLRNPQGNIVFIRHVDGKMMRLLKLDNPVPVTKTLNRQGVQVKLQVMQRERRFCQLVNGVTMVYFKEFGSERDLDRVTGDWAPANQKLPANRRATEIMHFIDLPDARTPYGVPCWVSQLPSVLGSRQAEEFNLEFFENGGVPPALIILQGGTMQSDTRRALERNLFGPAKDKVRVQVLEVEPSGGSMDHPGTARVTVERFGSERSTDSMFEGYDDKCEVRVRRAFRLPPIFVGSANDYSFATAYVSYNVAEAQVFSPEREEFDEIISMKLLPAMGYAEYKMVSKPLTIEDTTMKLQGIELAIATGQVDFADILYEINEACGTHVKVSPNPMPLPGQTTVVNGQVVQQPLMQNGQLDPRDAAYVDGATLPKNVPQKGKGVNSKGPGGGRVIGQSAPVSQPANQNAKNAAPVATPARKEEPLYVTDLARKVLVSINKRDLPALADAMKIVSTLDGYGYFEFEKACGELQSLTPLCDPEGMGELMAGAAQVLLPAHAH